MKIRNGFRTAMLTLAAITASGCALKPLVLRQPASAPSAEDCNPLGGGPGEDCLLPYPSAFFTKPDSKSPTGIRLDLKQGGLPQSRFGQHLDPTQYNRRDGFSSVATLLAYFPSRIDPSGLPGPDDTKRSQYAESPVQLIELDTGKRVPIFAELDANATSPEDKQALVLQPVVRLRPKTRYVAVIRKLKREDGRELAPLSGFRALRDGTTERGSRLDAQKENYEKIFARLSKLGVARKSLQLAWDFTTGSDEETVGRMLRMRDQASTSASKSARIHVKRFESGPYGMPDLMRRIQATFDAPSFLEGGNGNRLRYGQNGEPEMGEAAEFPLTIQVPECAWRAKKPLPVMIYGHGTFSSGRDELGTSYAREIGNRLCMIQVGTDWLGRSKKDLAYFLFRVIPNWSNFPQITDRLQQAHVNLVTLAKLIRSGALSELEELKLNGQSLVDEQRVYYHGVSEGGCQGITTLALSPEIERGALNVPCGFWSMFFWRSSDFHQWRSLMKLSYPESIEQHKLMALSQLLWDYTDPANYGAHVLRDPLPGNKPKRILYQEGINDASVPNLTTRAMARTIGLKLLTPRVEAVDGIEEASGPLDSGYVQYDVGIRPRLGLNNIPPATTSVHEDVRRLDAVQEQLKRFLQDDGTVQDTCGGKPCQFPVHKSNL